MTIRAGRRTAALALAPVALLALAACAERGARTPSAPPSAASLPGDAHALVLRVEYTGGFVTPSMLHARLPIVSIYADGRVITEGPVPAIYPGPALPNLQMQEVGQDAVQELLDRALAAGVAETSDLGTPPVADATFTRFTAVTADDTYVREVYALWESAEGGGLTAEQEGARERLSELLTSLTDQSAATEPYAPESVSAVVSPWSDPGDGLSQPEQPWPGPPLPGEAMGGLPDVTCVTATGGQAQAVLEAARSANAATPWTTGDGTRWSAVLRPLLPDETGCADLTD